MLKTLHTPIKTSTSLMENMLCDKGKIQVPSISTGLVWKVTRLKTSAPACAILSLCNCAIYQLHAGILQLVDWLSTEMNSKRRVCIFWFKKSKTNLWKIRNNDKTKQNRWLDKCFWESLRSSEIILMFLEEDGPSPWERGGLRLHEAVFSRMALYSSMGVGHIKVFTSKNLYAKDVYVSRQKTLIYRLRSPWKMKYRDYTDRK